LEVFARAKENALWKSTRFDYGACVFLEVKDISTEGGAKIVFCMCWQIQEFGLQKHELNSTKAAIVFTNINS
jgi:hypothetical protein